MSSVFAGRWMVTSSPNVNVAGHVPQNEYVVMVDSHGRFPFAPNVGGHVSLVDNKVEIVATRPKSPQIVFASTDTWPAVIMKGVTRADSGFGTVTMTRMAPSNPFTVGPIARAG